MQLKNCSNSITVRLDQPPITNAESDSVMLVEKATSAIISTTAYTIEQDADTPTRIILTTTNVPKSGKYFIQTPK